MADLENIYRSALEQGFMPICVSDRFDIELLAEASIAAGAKAIEITCRRKGAREEIQQVKRRFPDLLVFAGSVVDDGPLLGHLQRRQPDMPSIAQLMDAGADGIVSALPLQLQTIERLSRTHLVIPGVETLGEAVAAVESGAHLAKLFTADLMSGSARVRRLTCAATHALVPFFVTGGITLPRIAEYIDAGAAMLGSGWDVLLGEQYAALQEHPRDRALTDALQRFLLEFTRARAARRPWFADSARLTNSQFISSLEHFVPAKWLGPSERA